MEEKKITISNGKEYVVKEVKYKDMMANASEDRAASAKTLLQLATGITDEEYENLSMKDGILLQKAINTINGLDDDFLQQAPKESKE